MFVSVPICSFVCQVSEVSTKCEMRCELETRFKQIQSRLKALSQETDEVTRLTQALTSHFLSTRVTYLITSDGNDEECCKDINL